MNGLLITIRLKEKSPDFPDLMPDQPCFVIGIEANDRRILNDQGKPYLYPSDLFEVIDSHEPSLWVTAYGDAGERYSYPPELKEAGFFENYFDGKEDARSTFWHVVNKRLSEAAGTLTRLPGHVVILRVAEGDVDVGVLQAEDPRRLAGM